MNITSGSKTLVGLKPSELMKLAFGTSSDDETQVYELPTKPIVTRTPSEFLSMRAAILAELAADLIKTNPPIQIKEALLLFAGELGSISLEVRQFDAEAGGVN
jgi:hypothetical protein